MGGAGPPLYRVVALRESRINVEMVHERKKPDPIWLIAVEVSVVEAALLIIDIEPQSTSQFIEDWEDHSRPDGYNAAKGAVLSAVNTGAVDGSLVKNFPGAHEDKSFVEGPMYDVHKSTVNVNSLREWLYSKGYHRGVLTGPSLKLDGFRDPKHPRFSAKLAAAVDAWEAFDEASNEVGTPKQLMSKWLRMNAAKYDLVNEEGGPQETSIEDIAKVANWQTKGGAPKRADDESGPD